MKVTLAGVFDDSAPNPVSNHAFTKALQDAGFKFKYKTIKESLEHLS